MTKDEINLALFIASLIFGAFLMTIIFPSNDQSTVTRSVIQTDKGCCPCDPATQETPVKNTVLEITRA